MIKGDARAFSEETNKMIEENMAVPYEGQSKSDIEQAHLQNRVLLESKGIKHP